MTTCLKFDSMPAHPGKLAACDTCKQLVKCLERGAEPEEKKLARIFRPRIIGYGDHGYHTLLTEEKEMGKLDKMTEEERKAFFHDRGLKIAAAKTAKKNVKLRENPGGGNMSKPPEKPAPAGAQTPKRKFLEPAMDKAMAGAVSETQKAVASHISHTLVSRPGLTVSLTADVTHWPEERIKKFLDMVK